MSEYYAVIRSTDHLAHYGVKGMKWGVLKARYKENDKAMAKAYRKASKKLKKLNDRADLKKQMDEYAYHRKKGLKSSAGALGSVAGSLGGLAIYNNAAGFNNRIGMGIGMGSSLGSALLGTGLAAKSAYHTGKMVKSANRLTSKGHAKAVAKRDTWKKEMKSAFKGTQYDASGSVKKKKKVTK